MSYGGVCSIFNTNAVKSMLAKLNTTIALNSIIKRELQLMTGYEIKNTIDSQ